MRLLLFFSIILCCCSASLCLWMSFFRVGQFCHVIRYVLFNAKRIEMEMEKENVTYRWKRRETRMRLLFRGHHISAIDSKSQSFYILDMCGQWDEIRTFAKFMPASHGILMILITQQRYSWRSRACHSLLIFHLPQRKMGKVSKRIHWSIDFDFFLSK